ncbi:MAG: LemA family protein [Frankiales bacterium]|nr:LemA family protein [Frankiales bacterium]
MIELLAVLLVLLVVYGVAASNRFVRQRHLVEESWAQVEVELRRRQDLVPALVQCVRDFEQHESSTLRELVQAREAAVAATGEDVGPAEERLSRALHALPALQTGPVQQLQAQLAETEDRIAAARRFHTANVRALQTRLETFPSSVVARATGVEPPDVPVLSDRERAPLELPPETSA